jgi:hypothetical protein
MLKLYDSQLRPRSRRRKVQNPSIFALKRLLPLTLTLDNAPAPLVYFENREELQSGLTSTESAQYLN